MISKLWDGNLWGDVLYRNPQMGLYKVHHLNWVIQNTLYDHSIFQHEVSYKDENVDAYWAGTP